MSQRKVSTAIVVAAGSGTRMGTKSPKQFLDLAGRPLLAWSLAAFGSSDAVDSVVLVLPKRPRELELPDIGKPLYLATGGPTRQRSVSEGMMCVPSGSEVVLVHDAARPLVSPQLIERVVSAVAPPFSGAVPAVPVEDALKEVSSEREILRNVRRSALWRAQTPQGFRRDALEESLARADSANRDAEDCSELVAAAGFRVKVVPGDAANLKVTRKADFEMAMAMLRQRNLG